MCVEVIVCFLRHTVFLKDVATLPCERCVIDNSSMLANKHFGFAPPCACRIHRNIETRDLAPASMARDDANASSTASSTAPAMRGKVGSEFET